MGRTLLQEVLRTPLYKRQLQVGYKDVTQFAVLNRRATPMQLDRDPRGMSELFVAFSQS